MKVLVNTKNLSREEWLELRRKGIGGSDVAVALGLSPWKSPLALWLEKTGQLTPAELGEAAYWGTVLEEPITQEFSKRTGLKVRKKNAIIQHSEHPFMLANLDREIIDKEKGNGLLEVKTTGAHRGDDWSDEKVPDAYMLQIQHYLAVTGYQYAYAAVLIGGQRYLHTYIPRDEEVISQIIRLEKDFWRLVETGQQPDLDGSESCTEALSILYPRAKEESTLDLPEEAGMIINMFDYHRQKQKQHEEMKDSYVNQLKALLGENEIGVHGEHKVSWKNVTSKRLDTKRLQEEQLAVYAAYLKESTSRRFDVR